MTAVPADLGGGAVGRAKGDELLAGARHEPLVSGQAGSELALLHLLEEIRGVRVGGFVGFALGRIRGVEGRVVGPLLLRFGGSGGGLGLSEERLQLSFVHGKPLGWIVKASNSGRVRY